VSSVFKSSVRPSGRKRLASTTTRTKIALVATIVTVAAVIGVTVWATRTGHSAGSGLPSTHQEYAELFARATAGKTTTAVLNDWPKPPYQSFSSPVSKTQIDHCYEWYDKPVALYTLCFTKAGVLDNKEIG
jgi:hypothetical protein